MEQSSAYAPAAATGAGADGWGADGAGADHDAAHMRAAIALARRGLGNTWPNPSVGCVVVRDGRVVGHAVTAPGGRPHAETQALAMAGAAARGATAYVTLEPCCHQAVTPPCTDALIAAGVARVIVATADPDPRVDGGGIARLRAAGVVVETGLLGTEARELNAGFFSRIRAGRPLVTLKLATTLDGRIAARTGASRWITGEAARRAAHMLRGRHDAVLVGVETVLADDPDLTCRLPGFRPTPAVRVVADSRLRTPPDARLVRTTTEAPTWVLARGDADPDRAGALRDRGVVVLDVPPNTPNGAPAAPSAGIDLAAGLGALARRGITRVLAEGGGRIAASLLRADLVDRVAWFHAPGVMGGDGVPAAAALGVEHPAAMPRFVRERVSELGADLLIELRRAH